MMMSPSVYFSLSCDSVAFPWFHVYEFASKKKGFHACCDFFFPYRAFYWFFFRARHRLSPDTSKGMHHFNYFLCAVIFLYLMIYINFNCMCFVPPTIWMFVIVCDVVWNYECMQVGGHMKAADDKDSFRRKKDARPPYIVIKLAHEHPSICWMYHK